MDRESEGLIKSAQQAVETKWHLTVKHICEVSPRLRWRIPLQNRVDRGFGKHTSVSGWRKRTHWEGAEPFLPSRAKKSYNKSPASEDAHGQVWRINILSISEIKITDKINKWKPSEWPEHHLAIVKDFIKWVTCSHREERVACVLQHPALCNCVGHFILPTNKLWSGSENA